MWIDRERKLVRIILMPSIGIVWLLGLLLAWSQGYFGEGWFHAKLALVFVLSAYHGWMVGYSKKLAAGQRPVSGKALRIMNEVPGIATALIVILVIVRPF